MNRPVRFPGMRANVMSALRDLTDGELQERVWVRRELPDPSFLSGLDYVVHVLYDDNTVLPDPASMVGDVLHAGEVEPLKALSAQLDPLLDDLGDVSDEAYVRDPRWSAVMAAAAEALRVCEATGSGLGGEPSTS